MSGLWTERCPTGVVRGAGVPAAAGHARPGGGSRPDPRRVRRRARPHGAHAVRAGTVASPYPELPFGERVSRMYEESGEMLNQWFDFHLPQRHVTHDTPLWVGPAVFRTLVNPKLLDAVESVIGGEIYSNPVQHVRIKPPERRMGRQRDGRPVYGATVWHQDNGVIQTDGGRLRHPHRVVPDHRRAGPARLPARGAGQPPRRHLHPLPHGEGFQRGQDSGPPVSRSNARCRCRCDAATSCSCTSAPATAR